MNPQLRNVSSIYMLREIYCVNGLDGNEEQDLTIGAQAMSYNKETIHLSGALQMEIEKQRIEIPSAPVYPQSPTLFFTDTQFCYRRQAPTAHPTIL